MESGSVDDTRTRARGRVTWEDSLPVAVLPLSFPFLPVIFWGSVFSGLCAGFGFQVENANFGAELAGDLTS